MSLKKWIGLTLVALVGIFSACASFDNDADGYFSPQDCDDFNMAVNPDAPEVCGDHIDNNCDGKRDCKDPVCATQPGCAASAVPPTP
jgi:hypothetical protein